MNGLLPSNISRSSLFFRKGKYNPGQIGFFFVFGQVRPDCPVSLQNLENQNTFLAPQ